MSCITCASLLDQKRFHLSQPNHSINSKCHYKTSTYPCAAHLNFSKDSWTSLKAHTTITSIESIILQLISHVELHQGTTIIFSAVSHTIPIWLFFYNYNPKASYFPWWMTTKRSTINTVVERWGLNCSCKLKAHHHNIHVGQVPIPHSKARYRLKNTVLSGTML